MKHDVKPSESPACKEKHDVTLDTEDQCDTKPKKCDVQPSEFPASKEKCDVHSDKEDQHDAKPKKHDVKPKKHKSVRKEKCDVKSKTNKKTLDTNVNKRKNDE